MVSTLMSYQFYLLICVVPFQLMHGFKWSVDNKLPYGINEKYMFADKNGPKMLEQGNSYIDVQTDIISFTKYNRSVDVGFVVYAITNENKVDPYSNNSFFCYQLNNQQDSSSLATNVELALYKSQYIGHHNIINSELDLHGEYYTWKTMINYRYIVQTEAWHNVRFTLCNCIPHETVTGKVIGKVTFHNPYGFLPGDMFGLLPFEATRMICYVFFSVYFLYYYIRHWSSVLPLHHGFIMIFLFAWIEATLWYASYQSINLSGVPYCCPYPSYVVAALVMQLFRQTFSRAILLVVSLGYGIVRPKLMSAEWISITIISILYFAAAALDQISQIVQFQHSQGGSIKLSVWYKIPDLLMDIIYISWIYLAISSTIRILTEFQQTAKLKLYQHLVLIILVFVGLFTTVTFLFLLVENNWISLPWQVSWLYEVAWESLNFGILAAVCIVCLPTENSRLLSYAAQIPMEDPDEDLDDEIHDAINTFEMVNNPKGNHKNTKNASDEVGSKLKPYDKYMLNDEEEGDDQDDDEERVEGNGYHKKNETASNMYCLPSAMDEEEDIPTNKKISFNRNRKN